MFQSTYLYKVRPLAGTGDGVGTGFNPRTYIRYDYRFLPAFHLHGCFNPRTYIRYDVFDGVDDYGVCEFQSTYLYKVRHKSLDLAKGFNSVSIHVPI